VRPCCARLLCSANPEIGRGKSTLIPRMGFYPLQRTLGSDASRWQWKKRLCCYSEHIKGRGAAQYTAERTDQSIICGRAILFLYGSMVYWPAPACGRKSRDWILQNFKYEPPTSAQRKFLAQMRPPSPRKSDLRTRSRCKYSLTFFARHRTAQPRDPVSPAPAPFSNSTDHPRHVPPLVQHQ